MTKIVATLAVIIAIAIGGCSTSSNPEALVRGFYAIHLPSASTGLLGRDEIERRRVFLSSRLFEAYSRAIQRQSDWRRANPDDPAKRVFNKPPCVEGGDYFESLYEWPDVRSNSDDDPRQSFEVARGKRHASGAWHVQVKFSYDTTPTVSWTDVVVVVKERGRLAIDDVIYSGFGSFNRSGRLSEVLQDCAKNMGGKWRANGAAGANPPRVSRSWILGCVRVDAAERQAGGRAGQVFPLRPDAAVTESVSA